DQLNIAPADRAQFIRFARGERGGDELALPTQTAILVPTEHAALPTGTVTWLFSDIESSTTLWEQHPQAMRGALARHDAIMHSAITAYNGMVFKTVGDSVYAVFDRPADARAA